MTQNGKKYMEGVEKAAAHLPAPPRHWSYSSLAAFEQCPLRYALERADYPDLWDRRGYPPKPTVATLVGNVVHNALDLVLRALASAGCPDPASASFAEVMRELGGYTMVLEGVAADLLREVEGNPRLTQAQRDRLEVQLDERLEQCRATVQALVARMDLPNTEVLHRKVVAGESMRPAPASVGLHPEYVLHCDDPHVTGRLDLLCVSPDGAYITDYKTGRASSSHEEQLRFYAMLWHLDTVANPDDLPIVALTAAYAGGNVSVAPPTADEVSGLIAETSVRTACADRQLADVDLASTPGDQCATCPVRGLCSRYWATQVELPLSVGRGRWFDLEGELGQMNAARSRWFVATCGTRILLRAPGAPLSDYPDGRRVRLLGVLRDDDLDDDVAIAVLTGSTETLGLTSD